MSWDNELSELCNTRPFFFVSGCAAYNILKLRALVRERPQTFNWEDLIEPLPKCLELHLDRFMEQEVHGQVDVLLQVVESHVRVLTVYPHLYSIVPRKSKCQREILHSRARLFDEILGLQRS